MTEAQEGMQPLVRVLLKPRVQPLLGGGWMKQLLMQRWGCSQSSAEAEECVAATESWREQPLKQREQDHMTATVLCQRLHICTQNGNMGIPMGLAGHESL